MSTINNNSTSSTSAVVPVIGSAGSQRYAATEAQLEVWLSSQQSVEANCAYNEISSLLVRGELDLDKVKLALDKVVQRNASLRSTFSADGQEVIVHEQPNFSFESFDWSREDRSKLPELQNEIIDGLGNAPFDLENGPLFRVIVQTLDANQHKLTFAAHHAVLDGWSLAVFCQNLGHFYDQLCGVAVEPLPPVNQYSEYTTAMDDYFKSDEGQADEAFWVDQFSDSIPVLELPYTT